VPQLVPSATFDQMEVDVAGWQLRQGPSAAPEFSKVPPMMHPVTHVPPTQTSSALQAVAHVTVVLLLATVVVELGSVMVLVDSVEGVEVVVRMLDVVGVELMVGVELVLVLDVVVEVLGMVVELFVEGVDVLVEPRVTVLSEVMVVPLDVIVSVMTVVVMSPLIDVCVAEPLELELPDEAELLPGPFTITCIPESCCGCVASPRWFPPPPSVRPTVMPPSGAPQSATQST
jgi:hypothetical protein